MTPTRSPFDLMPNAQQAAILCNTVQFQTFAATRCAFPVDQMNPSAAAEYVRSICKVASRAHLDRDERAAGRFQALRTEYDAWRGRIAQPNP